MTTPSPTPYQDLNRVLQDLVDSVQAALAGNFVGAYLQGSFAVGDFDLNSDCDFIIVINEALSATEVAALQATHGRIFDLNIEWAKHLEGSYFPRHILLDTAHSGEELWYLDHGSRSLIQHPHCNTIVVRWVVRDYGVTLAGPPPQTLVHPIPVATLRREILSTMINWGQEILTTSDTYNNRFYQAFIVLSYCRMLHDLIRGYPGSKHAGAEWAKVNLDPCWTGLIDRTWAGRPNPAVSVRQQADPEDFKSTLKFVRYVTELAVATYSPPNTSDMG